jgi:arylsulfatase A-like enzyme
VNPIPRPNILLIQTDQQTAETLSLYGNPVMQTPALERLAEKGIVFELAFCNYHRSGRCAAASQGQSGRQAGEAKVMHVMDAMGRADDDLIRKVRAIHYGMIKFIDDMLATVFAKMESLDLS